VKWHARQYSDGTKERLKAKANEAMAMSPETCDLALMRHYSRTAWRWVEAYSRGLGDVLSSYAVRKSKSNRCVRDAVDPKVNRLADERKAAAEARASTGPAPVGLSLLGPLPEALAEMGTAGALCDADEEQDQGATLGIALALVSHVFSTTSCFFKKIIFCRTCPASYLKTYRGFSDKASVGLPQLGDIGVIFP